ncbi:MAG TPA: GntR family transcriptional regulator [Devosia sp.]|nr:GntR family transcriptional regulator [Devosia sp.]
MVNSTQFDLPEISGEYITAHEAVYHRLRNALMVGAIKPGTAMAIRALAQYLGHSPTPVREALRRLSSENALQVLDNRRIIVPFINAGQFDELILLRIKLECLAAERALPYVSQVLIEKMIGIDATMDNAVTEKQFDTLSVLNQQFHTVLYAANPNQTVMPLIESVWLQLGPFHRQMMDKTLSYYLVDHHKRIIGALNNRDKKELCSAIEADIREGIGRAGQEVLAGTDAKCA